MKLVNYIILTLLFSSGSLIAQLTKDQLVGRVVDVANNEGIEGVEVQLTNTNSIKYTDAEGKFKFENPKGFLVGEPNYSFLIRKEGYISTTSTDNKVVYGSGAIENMTMKKDIEKFLWITIIDGKTGNLLEKVKIDVKGNTKETNEFGKVSYDFSAYASKKIKAVLRKDCYKDEIREVQSKGEILIKLIPICNTSENKTPSRTIDINNAPQLLDRALKTRNGSKQGQIEALEFLLKSGYEFNNTNFDGVNLKAIHLPKANLRESSFDFSLLDGSKFEEADLSQSTLNFATATKLVLDNGKLFNARASFLEARNASFKGADLSYSVFFGCDFSNADFTGAILEGTVFSLCTLNGAIFDKSDLTHSWLYGSILDKASFKGALVKNTDIGGSVVLNGVFPFEEEQKKNLCRNLNYYNARDNRANFRFDVVEEDVRTEMGGGRFDMIMEERRLFRNFGGTTFNDCAIVPGLEDRKFQFNEARIRKTNEFLDIKSRRFYLRKKVKEHLNLLKANLIPKYTLKNIDTMQAWERKIQKSVAKKIDKKPILTRDVALILLLQNKLLKKDDIDWKEMASFHLGENPSSRGHSKKDERTYPILSQFLFPYNISYPDLPNNWDIYYKKWIETNMKSKINQVMVTFDASRPILREDGHIEFTFAKSSSLYRSAEKLLLEKGLSVQNILLLNEYLISLELKLLLAFPHTSHKAVLRPSKKIESGTLKQKGIQFRAAVALGNVDIMNINKEKFALFNADAVEIQYKIGKENWEKAKTYDFVEK